MHRKIRALALIFMMLVSCMPCQADMTGENGKTIPSVSVRIPVIHTIAGDKYKGDDNFLFTLTPEKAGNPMPEGSDGKSCTVTVTGEEQPDFGNITFEYPDEYYYTITREDKKHDDLRVDDSTYRVLVVKYNDAKTHMVIWDEDGIKVENIEYIDEYSKPTSTKVSSPKTGDETQVGLTVMLCAASVILLVLMIMRRKGTDNEE